MYITEKIDKYLGESIFKKNAVVKVINKSDDFFGKKGKIVIVGKGKDKDLYVIEFPDKQRVSYNHDEISENLLATIGSIGKMPGQWGKRLGTFGTVLAGAFRDAGIDIIGIKPIGKFDNEITVSYKGKQKKIKLTGDISASQVVKKITG